MRTRYVVGSALTFAVALALGVKHNWVGTIVWLCATGWVVVSGRIDNYHRVMEKRYPLAHQHLREAKREALRQFYMEVSRQMEADRNGDRHGAGAEGQDGEAGGAGRG